MFDEVAYTLRWWLLGQLVPIVVLGVSTMIGLSIMHIPLALTLGLFTATMIFIPYVGALLSEIPAVLVALMYGKAVKVLIFYLAVHCAEAYVLTPLAQRRSVRLPPALTLLSQLLMWTLAGLLGVAMATPLAATALVLIRKLYVKEEPAH